MKRIGAHNAAHIQFLGLAYPGFIETKDDGGVELRDDWVGLYDQIRDECTSLKTLVLQAPISQHFVDGNYKNPFDAWVVTQNAFEKKPEAFERQLELLRNLFSTFPCLKEVIIEIYSAGIKDDVRRRLLSYGFKIESIKDEDDDTDEWYFHEHEPDCDFYCPYDPREYEYDFDVTDDDDEHGGDWTDTEDDSD